MPSEAFIKAASASNRQPVVLLEIESVDAVTIPVTTEQDWLNSTLVNINTSAVPGQIRMATDGGQGASGPYTLNVVASGLVSVTPLTLLDYQRWGNYTDIFLANDRITGVIVNFTVTAQNFGSPVVALLGRFEGGSWQQLGAINCDAARYSSNVPFSLNKSGLERGFWEFRLQMIQYSSDFGQPTTTAVTVTSYQEMTETHYLETASVTTIPFDLELIPSVPSRFEAYKTTPADCTITYSAWGKDTLGEAWISLGAVSDGGELAPYRYYQIKADLTSSATGMETPLIDELRVIGGDSQYIYLSTHQDQPMQGALPYIVPGGISSISSKIDLTQQATVGELTIKLFWRRTTGAMIANDVLKNKTIICKLGFVGLSEVDYEPYFVGTWYDYQADANNKIITVKIRNILKRYSKKIPDAESFLLKERHHIAFGTSSIGAGLSHTPTGATYVGIYMDYSDTDSATPGDYTWTSLNSTNGSATANDKNGAARYLHIAFATNDDGTTGFSSISPTGATHVGWYIDGTLADSTDPVFYTWEEILPATNLMTVVWVKPATPIEIIFSGNIMLVMLDIADALGIPDRLINRPAFTTLSTGARSVTDWDVSRTFTEPQDAMELLNELSVSSGVFLFEGPDGRLTAKLYDDFSLAVPAGVLDAVHCKFKPIDGGQKDLCTRQAIYYNLQEGKTGDSENDFSDCLLKINVAAETAWFGDESSELTKGANTRTWKDKWNISNIAINLLAERWEEWFSIPRATVRVDDVPPRLYSLERGEVVSVYNLQMPCPDAYWPGYTVATRFIVMGKSVSDPTAGSLTISLDLMQLEVPTFSTTCSLPKYDLSEYTPTTWAALRKAWGLWQRWT
jgi:hypothetical protein